jgi:hypothetical protein
MYRVLFFGDDRPRSSIRHSLFSGRDDDSAQIVGAAWEAAAGWEPAPQFLAAHEETDE